jgi:uncharacterized protein (UPF0261 family)/ABC-type branched-subunit amino acid transport system ATPase component
MALFSRTRPGKADAPILKVEGLDVYYGRAHALQEVSFALERGVLGVVGRNGMGKSTLCNTIMGLVAGARGSVQVAGVEILGLAPNDVVEHGVSYVPQGRRVWPSLTVDEHLRLAARRAAPGADGQKGEPWTVQRVYATFPRLAERRGNGGAQLSGGEQQMLAIGRALLANPRLLVMDEPTEGLAPVIVDQLVAMLKSLATEGTISVLLIEQNLGVATSVADRIMVMVNGRLAHETGAVQLLADRDLQQRLLGVRAAEEEAEVEAPPALPPAEEPARVFQVRRASQEPAAEAEPVAALQPYSRRDTPTAWSTGAPPEERESAGPEAAPAQEVALAPGAISVAAVVGRNAYVVGTFDTKGRELAFIKSCLERLGIRAITVDLATTQRPSPADVGPGEVARHHPKGARAVFTGDRGSAVSAMADAFERFVTTRRDLAGIISAGGSGGTSLATPAMRRLPIGMPKIMVSTVASGDIKRYVGPSDICMMYSVVDVQGINRISEQVLSNAAHALAGMIAHSNPPGRRAGRRETRPAIGLTMFGVTTPCVQQATKQLEDRYDCLTFHATGTGGESMEKLVDSGLIAGVIDVTTTEVPDLLVGGVFPCTEDRFGAIERSRIPYVVSCGALDMVNFGPMDTVPAEFRNRNLYRHNPQVTLMRTTPAENARVGRWIAERINRCEGPVRFLIPEGGVSLIDAPGKPFWDPEADAALFRAIAETFRPAPNRQLLRLPYNINNPRFSDALVAAFNEVSRDRLAA